MKHDTKLVVYHWKDEDDYDGQRLPIVQTILEEHDPGANNTHIARIKMPDGSIMAFFVEIAALSPLTPTVFGKLKPFECFMHQDLEYFKTQGYKGNARGIGHESLITIDDHTIVSAQQYHG